MSADFGFSVSREALSRALALALPVARQNGPVLVLGSVLIAADADGLSLSTTDYDQTITVRLPADVRGAGKVALPVKRFADVVSSLPPGLVRLDATVAGLTATRARVSSGRAKFDLSGFHPDEWPDAVLDPVVNDVSVELPAATLLSALKRAATHTSRESTRPALNGVLLDARDDGLFVVATDGQRLYRERLSDAGRLRGRWNLHRESVAPALASFADCDGDLSFVAGSGRVSLAAGGVTLVSRLIETPFPQYEILLFLDGKDGEATIDRDLFTASIERVMALHDVLRVKLVWSSTEMTVSAEREGAGTIEDVVPCSYTGERAEYEFTPRHLLGVLGVLTGDAVVVQLNGGRNPIYVRDAAGGAGSCVLQALREGIASPTTTAPRRTRAATKGEPHAVRS